jgi:hypothetical protein
MKRVTPSSKLSATLKAMTPSRIHSERSDMIDVDYLM